MIIVIQASLLLLSLWFLLCLSYLDNDGVVVGFVPAVSSTTNSKSMIRTRFGTLIDESHQHQLQYHSYLPSRTRSNNQQRINTITTPLFVSTSPPPPASPSSSSTSSSSSSNSTTTSDTANTQQNGVDSSSFSTSRSSRNRQPHHHQQQQEEGIRSNEGTMPSPLCMTIDEVAQELGGRGRAAIVWDCLVQGIDPILFLEQQQSNEPMALEGISSYLKLGGKGTTSIEDALELMPKKRRLNLSQGMGTTSIEKLKRLFTSQQTTKSTMIGSSDDNDNSFAAAAEKEGILLSSSSVTIESAIGRLSQINTSRDGTTKLLIQMAFDGLEVETVIIPWFDREKPSSTLCVSSQVGCRQGCTFCATGRMGKLRSLRADEIVLQLYVATQVVRLLQLDNTLVPTKYLPPIDNIVFMGMGEPADNVSNVVRAAQIMTNRQLFQLSQSKVTISTVAPAPESFMELSDANTTLAWSVHAVSDELRKKLVPTTKYTMAQLRYGFVQALAKRTSNSLRTTMLEVALIDHVNDCPEHAMELAQFCHDLIDEVKQNDKQLLGDDSSTRAIKPIKLVVNLIPWNDISTSNESSSNPLGYRQPSKERVLAFQNILTQQGIYTFTRHTRGDDESAACGQLATKKRPNKMKEPALDV